MEVDLDAELETKISEIATATGRDASSVVQEAIERYLSQDAWFLAEVEKGLAAADRGELIDHEDVLALIEKRYKA